MKMSEKVDALRKRIQEMKKEDYIVLVLLGILLVVIAIPTEQKSYTFFGGEKENSNVERLEKNKTVSIQQNGKSIQKDGTNRQEMQENERTVRSTFQLADLDLVTRETLTYGYEMELKLEHMLEQMEGVGDVSVMITLSESGKNLIEKDITYSTDKNQEADSQGGTRNVEQSQEERKTVYTVDGQGENIPLVVQKQMPKVTGVLIIAQGAEKKDVKEHIIQATKVLFQISQHNIKVITMKS